MLTLSVEYKLINQIHLHTKPQAWVTNIAS